MKNGASGSVLITTIVLEELTPARCWIAPEIPIAIYRLGATGKKDLGHYFPSNESTPKDISSTDIFSEILNVVEYEKFSLTNVDITIITQKFNVQDKAVKIQNNLSKLLKVSVEKINVKGKSSDDYGIIGDQKASLAIVSLLLDDA